MPLFITLPLEIDQDLSTVDIACPVNLGDFKRVENEHADRARSYRQAVAKTPAPKTTPVSPKSLELKQKRYAARAAAYAGAISKTNQLLKSAKPSHKPKPLVVKTCAKPLRAGVHRSHRVHRARPTHASSSSAGSSDGPPST